MDYVIMMSKMVHLDESVSFDHSGNKYRVAMYKGDRYDHKTFDNIEDAAKIYCSIIEMYVMGRYSYEDKVNMFLKGE